MRLTCSLVLGGSLLSFATFAGTMGDSLTNYNPHPWLAVASLGYTVFDNSGPGSGQTAIGRFALGKSLHQFGERDTDSNLFQANLIDIGIEFGVQNGARLALAASQAQQLAFNGTGARIQSTIRPMLDFLGTMTFSPMEQHHFFLSAKLGLAYRQWQMDYATINNLSQVTGELQAGVGVPVGEASALSILYQGFYGSSPKLSVNSLNHTASVSNIPAQNGVLVSLSLLL